MPAAHPRTPTPVDGSGPARPGFVVLVAGTATEVGKTWVMAQVARRLRHTGLVVAARKPAQSHEPGDVETDAAVLAKATGEIARVVCREDRDYAVPMAPPMAASTLGLAPFTVADLVAELEWPRGCDIGLVESVGGIRSPIATDGDTLELARQLHPDLVALVADAGLGVINALRLCVAALDPIRPVVVLNRFDDGQELHRRNLDWLRDVDGLDLVTSPQALTDRLLRLLDERR
ncbi:MAG: ATP-dependent dethiobiotin synthetase BioD [Acidimicrobiales bacterium]